LKLHIKMATNGTHAPKPVATKLRELLARPGQITVGPGVYDGLTARIALRQGFECLYMVRISLIRFTILTPLQTGAGTAASRLGMADLALADFTDMLTNASMIASLDRTVPVIADADTGYGGPIMVARTVKSYIAAGIAGLHLEDQVITKRCGHLEGKELVDEETYITRIRAAALAREEMKALRGEAGDIVIIARTDALQSYGFEEAERRLKNAVAAGADVAFLEGFTTVEQGKKICESMSPTPVLFNMIAGGVTPDMTTEEAKKLGFKLIIYPCLMLSTVLTSCEDAASELKSTGYVTLTTRQKKNGIKGIFEMCGLDECTAFDKKAGGNAFANGV
jgi:2-methylisocitrate lyase-like PEP mutase family enzyme